jgi:hypothetical protein
MIFVSSNRNTTGATCETGTANLPEHLSSPPVLVLLDLWFSGLRFVVRCLSLFIWPLYLSVLFRFTASDPPFDIFKRCVRYIYTWTLSEFPNSLALSQPTSKYLTACYKFRHDYYETTSWWRQPYNVWCEGGQFWLRITLVENVMCK